MVFMDKSKYHGTSTQIASKTNLKKNNQQEVETTTKKS